MSKMIRRTANSTHYKWRITGTLNNQPVDKRYLSIQDFLNEFGGDKTPLHLNRHKIKRFRTKQKNPLWDLEVIPIKEKRMKHVVYLD